MNPRSPALALCLALLTACSAAKSVEPAAGPAPEDQAPPPDAWETAPARRPGQQACVPVADGAILPVTAARRSEAIARLRNAEILPLTRQEAADLTKPRPESGSLQPFLVRAVTKNEVAGIFTGEVCGGTLSITHRSMGFIEPPSVRFPVVVFLDRQPSALIVDWSMPR